MKTTQKILSLSLLFLLISCGKTTKKEETSSTNSIEFNNKGTHKLNALVNVFNSFSTTSYDSYSKYIQTFGDNPEKFKKIRNWYNGASINSFASTKIKELEKTAKINIYVELDSLILDYKKKAEKLTKILNNSFSYYDMKDYESDNFAKAKEFHKPTLDAYNNFFIVDNLLRKKADIIQSELEIIRLNKLKEEGDTLNYLVGMAINTATKLLNVTQSEQYKNLNLVDLEKTQAEVRIIFDELTQFKNEKPDEFNANHRMSWFYNSFKDFVKAGKSLVNRKKANKPFSTGEKMNLNASSGWMVKGSTYQVLKEYNDLVNEYNSLIK